MIYDVAAHPLVSTERHSHDLLSCAPAPHGVRSPRAQGPDREGGVTALSDRFCLDRQAVHSALRLAEAHGGNLHE